MSQCDEVRSDAMSVRTIVSWSSGKDCATALQKLRNDLTVAVVGLLTTVNEVYDRVAMHATRRELLERQAVAVGLPLHIVPIRSPCSNEEYEARTSQCLLQLKEQHVEQIAFGDLFLDDIRDYRERQMEPTGIKPIFPLWGSDTRQLAGDIIRNGTKAIITCVDPKRLDASFVGRDYDQKFLDDLPDHVDPCGENGEFHTFVYDGPMFHTALKVTRGEMVERDGFVFADLTLRE